WISAIAIGRLELRVLRLIKPFDGAERLFFAGCLGLGSLSLLMLGLGLAGLMNRWPLVAIMLASCLAEFWLTRRESGALNSRQSHPETSCQSALRELTTDGLSKLVLATVFPFVFCLLLGAMSPQTDFDVVEYHLGGPKEWFQQDQITRLPH